jgi:renalase
MSTLRLEQGEWDLGAQYFTARDPAFMDWLQDHVAAGRVAAWRSGPPEAHVAVPGMDALVAELAQRYEVTFGVQISRCDRDRTGWTVGSADARYGTFDALLLAVPAEQAAPLLAMQDLDLARDALAARSLPCWTTMVSFAEPLPGLPPFLRDAGPIAWAARNNSKPGRPAGECWVLQARPDWSIAQLELPAPEVAATMLATFSEVCRTELPQPQFLKAHRWRFAMSTGTRGRPVWSASLGLGACGDWCQGARVEDAWLSGRALAETLDASRDPSLESPVSVGRNLV